MTDDVRVVEFRDGRPVVIPGATARAHITDEGLQYLVDVVADEAAKIKQQGANHD